MNVYRLSDDAGVSYHGTLRDAQQHGKTNVSATFRGALRLELIDVPTDKANVLRLLNNSAETREWLESIEPVRVWRMTARGGLKDSSN